MPTNTYAPILTKGPESTLQSVEDGKLRITSDTGRIFIDDNNTRTEVTDFIRGLTEEEIKAQLAPLTNKIYIASDTNKFMIYNTTQDDWTNVAVVDVASQDVIIDITRVGFDFIGTRINGSTFSFNQQQYTGTDGISINNTTISNSGVRSITTGTSNGTINVNINGTTADIAVKGLAALAYKASLGKSDVGLGNVANLDQSKAIKSITRSGTTFTATAIDGSTSSFTQQDNNTTYTGSNGISLSGTTFSNSGVRSITTGTSNGTINVNTNGSTANVAVKGLGSAAYTESSAYAPASHTHSYLPLSGGTLTGALNTANNTYNNIGDDVAIGDVNAAGILGIKGLNGNTGIRFVPYSGSTAQTISINGSGTMTITGTVSANKFIGDISSGTGLTKSQVTTALGYTPPTTNTTYSANNGVSLSGTTFSNSGVRSIATGSANGTISVNTNGTAADVAVKGLGSAAYNNSGAFRWTNGAGTWSCSGNGQNYYYRIATITIGGNYVNGPILFHLGGRGYHQTNLIIRFQSVNNTDPGLDFIQSDIYQGYYIRKTATSTWEVIGRYNEVWGKADLYYIENYSVSITVKMENIGQELPSGCTQATKLFAFPSDISTLQSNFQAGVDSVYNAIKAQGTTPASKSLSDVVTGIGTLSTNRYNAGTSAGYTSGYNAGTTAGYNTKKNQLTGTYKPTSNGTKIDMGADHKYRYVNTNTVFTDGYYDKADSMTSTYSPTSRASKLDMGYDHSYRYVNTNGVPNSNSGTYKLGTLFDAVDMGASNSYQYCQGNWSVSKINCSIYGTGTNTYSFTTAANSYYIVSLAVVGSTSGTVSLNLSGSMATKVQSYEPYTWYRTYIVKSTGVVNATCGCTSGYSWVCSVYRIY